ncbi:cupredoxin domain-containing protein [Paenibacillus sp. GCM10027626]|uniref:cupredoxin domain-containing protein n=1 Tax=Paenibacillus sp. GCM10027626 TaxID=3273411 RepID=UPI0036346412
MLKKAAFLMMLAALILVVAACGSSGKNNDKQPASGNKETEQTASAEVVIKASNWEFDQPTYTIKKGEPTKITLESLSGVHGITVDKIIKDLDNGKSEVVTVNEAGEYELYCSRLCGTGHSKMKAKLIVE